MIVETAIIVAGLLGLAGIGRDAWLSALRLRSEAEAKRAEVEANAISAELRNRVTAVEQQLARLSLRG